jgi:23S rRNA (cytosine1962-C5)-methyltransferase
MKLSLFTPPGDWADYELLDSGDGLKLERFGSWIISRPEPQALWAPNLGESEWAARAHAVFQKSKGGGAEERGQWVLKKGMPEQWWMSYGGLKFRLGLTSFKHVGIFPEQAVNWDYIMQAVTDLQARGVAQPQVLNLFAYTGGASLAGAAAGAAVTHVDSVKQTISWSRENMEASGLDGIRWVVEDALKFVRREVRRGKKYHGIILDPPAYGRGAEGEKWVLEEHLREMLGLCAELLDVEHGFLVLNLYSMGLSALLARTLAGTVFRQLSAPDTEAEQGELYLQDPFGKRLPLGIFLRFRKK